MNALCEAAKENRIDDVIRLVTVDKVDVNVIDNNRDKWTPLFYAVFNNHIKMTKCLIDLGANVNYKDIGGNIPLQYANFISAGNMEIAELLLKNGTDINVMFNGRNTQLHIAVLNSDIKLIKLLMDHGADKTIKDIDGKTPAELTGNKNIHQLLDSYNLDIKEPDM